MIAPTAKTASTRREGDLPPRERILAAARALFYRRGIHVVGVDAIAEAAGTNKMTLYRHFPSKDELVAEYLRQSASEADECWADLERAHPGDALGLILLEVADMPQPGQKLSFGIAGMRGRDRFPGHIEFPREFTKACGDQHVF